MFSFNHLVSSEQYNNLVHKYIMIEGLFLISENMIHEAYFITPDVGNTD